MKKHPLCILHAGMHKTGTTTIQSTFYHHLQQSQKFHYLHVDSLNLTPELFTLFRPKKIETILHRYHIWDQSKLFLEQHTKSIHQKLKKYIEQSQGIGIISAEMISDMNEDEFIQLVDFLKKFYQDIHLIAYVRPPQSYINSMMAQKVQEGLFVFSPKLFYPHYQARFEKFDRVLGKCNVTLIPYVRSELIQQDIVTDFCYHAGIEVSDLSGKKNENPSLTLETLSLLWFYNYYENLSHQEDFSQIRSNIQALLDLFQSRGKNPFVLHPSLTMPILSYYQSDINWMEKRLGHTLSEASPDSNTVTVSSEKDILAYGYKEMLSLLDMEGSQKSKQEGIFLVKKLQQLSGIDGKIIPYSKSKIEQIENILYNEMIRESLLSPESSI